MGAGISKSSTMGWPRKRDDMIKQNAMAARPQELSRSDCENLKRSWLIVAPDDIQQFELLYEFGVDVYDQIFIAAPELMKFFPSIQAAAERSHNLRQIPAFRNQALRLVDVLSYSIQNCDCLASLEPKLCELGRRHRMYVRNGALTRETFRVVEKATLIALKARLEQYRSGDQEATLDEDTVQNMLQAWSALLDYIVYQILAGYHGD